MGKTSCLGCNSTHKKSADRIKCLKAHGLWKSSGVKRLDPVLKEHVLEKHQEEKEEGGIQGQLSKETKNHSEQNSEELTLKTSNRVVIVDNVSMLRHNNHRMVNRPIDTTIKHRNFARVINSKEKKGKMNIVQQIMEEEEMFEDHNYKILRVKKGIKKVTQMAMDFEQKRDTVLQKLTERYIVDCFKNEFVFWFGKSLSQTIDEKQMKSLRIQCSEDVQAYYQSTFYGALRVSEAKFQPIDDLLDCKEWERLDSEDMRQAERKMLSDMKEEEQQIELEKRQLFNKFEQLTFEEVEPLLFKWTKVLQLNDSGQVVGFDKIKKCPLSKNDYDEEYGCHLKDIRPRFQRLYNFYLNSCNSNREMVKKDIDKYSSFGAELEKYHIELKIKLKQRREEQSNAYDLEWRMLQTLAKTRNQKEKAFLQQERGYFGVKRIIESEDDLNDCLNFLASQKNATGKSFSMYSATAKIVYLLSKKKVFIPETYANDKRFTKKDNYEKKTFLFFKDCPETRSLLENLLQKTIVRHQGAVIRGSFHMVPKIKQWQPKIYENNSTLEAQIWMKEISSLTLRRRQGNLEQQFEYLKKYECAQQTLLDIDFLLAINRWRGIKTRTFKQIFRQKCPIRDDKQVKEFIETFPNFFISNETVIFCPHLVSQTKRIGEFELYKRVIEQACFPSLPAEVPCHNKEVEAGIMNLAILKTTHDIQIQYEKTREEQESQFCLVEYDISKNKIQFASELLEYHTQRQPNRRFLKKLQERSDKLGQLNFLLKSCQFCGKDFTGADYRRMVCRFCFSEVHQTCSFSLRTCFCQGLRIPFQKVRGGEQFNQSYQELRMQEDPHLTRTKYQGINLFKPTTERSLIEEEENKIKMILSQRGLFFTFNARIHKQLLPFEVKHISDPLLTSADPLLSKIYQVYLTGSYKAPVKLKDHGEDNFGIEAMEPIPKMTFLCEYAADIIPSAYCSHLLWKDHIMIFFQGRTSKEELVLAPINCCNWGALFNHSEKGNCGTVRVIVNNCVRVLMFSTRNIKAGEELLYNYNNYYHQFPTEGFQDLAIQKAV